MSDTQECLLRAALREYADLHSNFLECVRKGHVQREIEIALLRDECEQEIVDKFKDLRAKLSDVEVAQKQLAACKAALRTAHITVGLLLPDVFDDECAVEVSDTMEELRDLLATLENGQERMPYQEPPCARVADLMDWPRQKKGWL